MRQLAINVSNLSVCRPTGRPVSPKMAMDLLAALITVDLQGPQMFERDSLSFLFEEWARADAGQIVPVSEMVTAGDILAAVADIRALPQTNSGVATVDVDLLSAVDDIEEFVTGRLPTLQ